MVAQYFSFSLSLFSSIKVFFSVFSSFTWFFFSGDIEQLVSVKVFISLGWMPDYLQTVLPLFGSAGQRKRTWSTDHCGPHAPRDPTSRHADGESSRAVAQCHREDECCPAGFARTQRQVLEEALQWDFLSRISLCGVVALFILGFFSLQVFASDVCEPTRAKHTGHSRSERSGLCPRSWPDRKLERLADCGLTRELKPLRYPGGHQQQLGTPDALVQLLRWPEQCLYPAEQ